MNLRARVPVAERTCISCRRVGPFSELIRLVVIENSVLVAESGSSGRGAWICRNSRCIDGLHQGALHRAFRRKISDPDCNEAALARLKSALRLVLTQ